MVPDDIKSVDRPKNTVVVDTGSSGGRRYAVRERAGYKMTAGNNPGPRNGKIIGYICSGRFIPKSEFINDVSKNTSERLQYGAAAFVHATCADIYSDLLECFTVEDANRIFTIASLRVTNPGIACNRYASKARMSFISKLYPCIGLSKNSITQLLENLGKAPTRLKDFYALRLNNVAESSNLMIDGVLKQDTGDNTLSMPSAKTHLKGHKEISVIYAYDHDMAEVICAKAYQGNMLDAKAFRDFILDNKIERGTIVCDKGFNVSKISDLLEQYPDLHYIAPIKRNDKRIFEHNMLACDSTAILNNGHMVMYKKLKLADGTFMYTVRDVTRGEAEKHAILHRINDDTASLDGDKFLESMWIHGTITFLSDRDLDPLDVLEYYSNRWLLEIVFDHYKNTLDLDITRVQSKQAVIGNEFINFIATLMLCKIITPIKKLEKDRELTRLSIRTRLEDLRDIDRNVDAPFRGHIDDGCWNVPARDSAFELLVKLGLADASQSYLESISSKRRRSPKSKTRAADKPDDYGCNETGTELKPLKRGPGRPKGSKNKKTLLQEASFVGPMPKKRGRGRPAGSRNRKLVEFEAAFVGPMPKKRGRGRPAGSRNRKLVEFEASFVGPMPAKRKPGRPAGSKNKKTTTSLESSLPVSKIWPWAKYSRKHTREFHAAFVGPMPAKRRPGRPPGSKTTRVYV